MFKWITASLSVPAASVLIASANALGLLIGLVRTNLINDNFNHFSTSAWFAAFKVPDFLFFTLVAGTGFVIIPIISDQLSRRQSQAAWDLASSVINMMALVTLILSLLLIIFPEPILRHIITPGFSQAQLETTSQILRLVAINPLVFSISSILASCQQVLGRFFFMAFAPLIYNLAIIASIYLFKDSFGIVGLGLGVVIGTCLNLIFISFGFYKTRFRWRPLIKFKDSGFKEVMSLLPTRWLDQSLTYLNGIVQVRLASGISLHAVANFENALMIYNAPIGLVGWAIGAAAFPHFSRRLSQKRTDLFRKDFLAVLRMVIWLSVPIAILGYFCRDYLARAISPRDSSEIALIFAFLVFGILFRMIYLIFIRYYYAQKDIRSPLKATLAALIFNICLAWYLTGPAGLGVVGLALAAVLSVILEVGVLLVAMIKRDRGLFDRAYLSGLATIGWVGTLLVAYLALLTRFVSFNNSDSGWDLLFKLVALAVSGSLVYLLLSWFYRIGEARLFFKRLARYWTAWF